MLDIWNMIDYNEILFLIYAISKKKKYNLRCW